MGRSGCDIGALAVRLERMRRDRAGGIGQVKASLALNRLRIGAAPATDRIHVRDDLERVGIHILPPVPTGLEEFQIVGVVNSLPRGGAVILRRDDVTTRNPGCLEQDIGAFGHLRIGNV